MSQADVKHRDQRIVELRAQGLTLDEIGLQFGLTRERVRQIVKKSNGASAAGIRRKNASRKNNLKKVKLGRVRAFIETHPGCTIEGIAAATGISVDAVAALIPKDLQRLVMPENPRVDREDPRVHVLDSLRKAATYEWPLTRPGYDELLRVGEVEGLSAVRIDQLFGSWTAACTEAGVESIVLNREYQSRWTDTDLLTFVTDYLRQPSSTGTYADFGSWLSGVPDAPSSQTIRNRLNGTWTEVKRMALESIRQESETVGMLLKEGQLLDAKLAKTMTADARASTWASARSILGHGPLGDGAPSSTCLALGFVQSGKTTSITALLAAAADSGYKIAIAFLGSTNLLLEQNRDRVEDALGIGDRHDYVWVSEENPSGSRGQKIIRTHLERDRVVLIPVLKHAGRISALAECLNGLGEIPALIIDDEADQASLNTAGEAAESRTYQAIKALRASLPNHLYVQYTATPYAPLLLEAEDLLHPDHVEFLQPGPGYIGGREFFIEYADRVVRDVPVLEEQASKSPPLELQGSLVRALGSFTAGAVLMLADPNCKPPISMLVHSTARNDVQDRYHFLINRQLKSWRQDLQANKSIPQEVEDERQRLVHSGVTDLSKKEFQEGLATVLREAHIWLVNSTSALNHVDWTVSPVHILVGGNKLDRGFTVEGLTVTYLNRPASTQVDTLEQRARAFGYRGNELPYCQFFASKMTIRALRNIVFTEYDLRARLQDHVDQGGSVHSWATEIGLLIPDGMKPTRDVVVQALTRTSSGWQSERQPVLDPPLVSKNKELLDKLGLFDADIVSYGRLQFRTLKIPVSQLLADFLQQWIVDEKSPAWRQEEVIAYIQRLEPHFPMAKILLMDDQGSPRLRRWDSQTGFINLFQGRDLNFHKAIDAYPGDRQTPDLEENPDQLVVQVHRVVRRGAEDAGEVLPLAIYLGSQTTVRKIDVETT